MSLDTEIVRQTCEIRTVQIPADGITLSGELTNPRGATGLVIFSRGKGLGPDDSHNRAVAKIFNKYHLATLLTEYPASTHLALWLRSNPDTSDLPLGYYSTDGGVSAALITAAQQPEMIKAVVSCGGKPASAIEYLAMVRAPVLLIAGGRDQEGLRSSQAALRKLNPISMLNVIPRSFDDPSATDEAVQLAALWFSQHLG